MKIEHLRWTQHGWQRYGDNNDPFHDVPDNIRESRRSVQLILLFGATDHLKSEEWREPIKAAYPSAHFVGCSTAGEIFDTQVTEGSLVATAIQFEHTRIQGNYIRIEDAENSFQAGARLAQTFDRQDLVHLFVLSDGLCANGSDLIRGLRSQLPDTVTLTGGLSGDGDRFQETLVLSDHTIDRGLIAAVGLYGNRLQVGYGSLGGWAPFGPKRLVTKSQGNVLYELDGQSALELYQKYLGNYASGLPATGLLFPLNLYNVNGERSVVRTILAVNETEQSLTFAGDVPEGSIVQLMQANGDRLVDGAIAAARASRVSNPDTAPDLAILISCVGRKLVLKQRVEEEVEGIRDVMGDSTILTGFYSYGEIAPTELGEFCQLHNQTMTITTFLEQ
jgi:hypothetical protein